MPPKAESQLGLLQLFPEPGTPQKKVGIDIVAIHGLGGHRTKSWTSDDGNMWLKDQLPQAYRTPALNPRISTFGYDAEVAFTSSRGTLEEYALQLLSSVHAERLKTKTTGVPLVFICHSLGGIVGKKALLVAHQKPSPFSDIQQCLRGIVFIGTPHLGASDTIIWLKRLLTMGKLLTGGRVRDDLHKLLLPKSPEVSDICKQAEKPLSTLKVVSTYELQRTGNVLIVDKSSAQMAGQMLVPMDRDHVSICKYSRADVQGYRNFSLPIDQLLVDLALV